mgnify:CR=1 FL=1
MNDNFDLTTATSATEQTPTVDAITADTTTDTPAPATLPKNYLVGGYYATTDKGAKYLRPEFVDEYARNIAASLNEMKPSDFAAMLERRRLPNCSPVQSALSTRKKPRPF